MRRQRAVASWEAEEEEPAQAGGKKGPGALVVPCASGGCSGMFSLPCVSLPNALFFSLSLLLSLSLFSSLLHAFLPPCPFAFLLFAFCLCAYLTSL